MNEIILASQSPRRVEILKEILQDIPFKTVPSHFNERNLHDSNPSRLCLNEARGKALDVQKTYPNDYIIASDTMVVYENKQLGKPKDELDALNMLRLLSGNTHDILTSYVIYYRGKELVGKVVKASLWMEKMSDYEIKEYIRTGSPFDKAGGYGVQDKDFITSRIVRGDITTIMGLSKDELEDDLIRLNIIK